jgi:hypothetical protein
MGVLGIIVGVTFVLPLDQQGIIRVFWLGALGVLFLGRMPSGMPKAWTTGSAEPWPSQQQLREQRQAARADRGAPADDASGAARPEPDRGTSPSQRTPAKAPPPAPPSPRRPDPAAAGTEHSASKKRKRKRRS